MEREADAHLHLSPPCMSLTEISSFMDDFIYKQDPLAFSFLPEPAFVEGKLHLSLCPDSPLAPRGGACRAAWFRDSIMIGMCVDGCALEEQHVFVTFTKFFFNWLWSRHINIITSILLLQYHTDSNGWKKRTLLLSVLMNFFFGAAARLQKSQIEIFAGVQMMCSKPACSTITQFRTLRRMFHRSVSNCWREIHSIWILSGPWTPQEDGSLIYSQTFFLMHFLPHRSINPWRK